MREYLKKLREQKGLTQQEVATQLGIAQNYYSNIENGERQPKLQMGIIGGLSKILGIPIENLYELEVQYKEE